VVLWEREPRFVLALVEGLPMGCEFHASVQGDPEFRGWGVREHIFANLYDLTAVAGGVTESKGSKKAPTHPRPGQKKQQHGGGVPLLAMIGKPFGGG
jgi:hypothetical protein